jgi:hypothetical protein
MHIWKPQLVGRKLQVDGRAPVHCFCESSSLIFRQYTVAGPGPAQPNQSLLHFDDFQVSDSRCVLNPQTATPTPALHLSAKELCPRLVVLHDLEVKNLVKHVNFGECTY